MRKSLFFAVLCAQVAGLIVGCGTSSLAPAAGSAVQGAAFQGAVMGGLQPVSFATLNIYAMGTTGYGKGSYSLLTRSVSTDANGNFNFAGAYNCPSYSTQVYMTATGGNPGLAPGTNNAALSEIALLGECGFTASTPTFVTINELTTAAAVYSLQSFMTSAVAIGAPASNQAGLLSGVQTAQNLVNLAGHTPGDAPPANATIPTVELNSIADVLSACVNSDGTVSANSTCGRLFAAVAPTGTTAPTDTVGALLGMARNPGYNARTIFNLISSSAAYQPTLKTAPADWSVAINYTAPAFNKPADLAVDGQGMVWVLAAPGTGNVGATTLSTVSNAGLGATYVQPATGFGNMAIDRYGDIWLTDANRSDVAEFTPSGSLAGTFTGGGMVGPGPLAFDPAGNAWVVNSSATVSELSASGVPVFSNAFATGGSSGPVTIAIDSLGQVWTADSASNTVSKMTNSGAPVAGSPYSNSNISSPSAVAIDAANGAWVPNQSASTLTRLAGNGNPPEMTNVSGGGLLVPIAMTLDGNGTAWAVNAGANTISALPVTNSTQTGYGSAFLTNPYKLAIDGSGNVWVANLGTPTAGSGVITQIVGAAAPVVTPLAVAVKNGQIAQKP